MDCVAKSFNDLPGELFLNILGYLDILRPSTAFLLEEPTFEATSSTTKDLKAASLVSKGWRAICLPKLFRHARFVLPIPDIKYIGQQVLMNEIQPFFNFVKKNSFSDIINTFVLSIHNEDIASYPGPPRPDGFLRFWSTFLSTVNPVDLLIVAPPKALGSLTSIQVDLRDSWIINCPCQYLRLQRAEDSPPEEVTEVQPTIDASEELPVIETIYGEHMGIFGLREWSKLLLNEGSFIKAYSTYEFSQRHPPSILGKLVMLERLPKELSNMEEFNPPRITPSIREMSYIGIFPMESHFARLIEHLPRLDQLYVQIAPRSNILDDAEKMKEVDTEDLWMERNRCYAILIRDLLNPPPHHKAKYLTRFESGDAAGDLEAWNRGVEHVNRAGSNWRVQSDGVFMRQDE